MTWVCIEFNENKIKKCQNESVSAKSNREINWKEMDDIKLIVELEAVSNLELCAKVAI